MAEPARIHYDDELHLDPAEAAMSAAVEIIQRAHAICGHPPAVEIIPELRQRAALARQEAREIPYALGIELDREAEPENEMDDDFDQSFAAACQRADDRQRGAPADPSITRARRLLADDVSLERAYAEINAIEGRAANSTVEALMFSLRSHGVQALDQTATRRRLPELSDEQVIEVGARLRKLQAEIARPWTADEVSTLMQSRERRQ
jgi:hypothetical protein